jgi:hypothetical protein
MKIGTSLGKCVKSILAGEVNEEDVLFIVSNTMAPDLEKLNEVIEHYFYQYQGSHLPREKEYDMSAYSLDDAKALAQRLMETGKLHQPRCVGSRVWGNAHSLKDTWYDIVPSSTTDNESVREAWNHYTMIKNLAA